MKRFLPLALLCLAPFAPVSAAPANDEALPRPAQLEPDVQFWIRVYSEVSTNEGFIHDQHKLSVIYETLHFDADAPPRERAHRVDAERSRVQEILRHLASGAAAQTDEERHVRDLWGADATPARLAEAVDDVRFQLGQSDRFRAGLQRAAAWDTHIAEVLANLGLPAQIAALPHVESSFDPTAYSKVGAAGLWQTLLKLHTRASLLLVTAHPDDETAGGGLLAYETLAVHALDRPAISAHRRGRR